MAAVHYYVCIRLPTVGKIILLYLNYHNNTLDRSYIPEPIRYALKIRKLYHNKLCQIEVHDQINVAGGIVLHKINGRGKLIFLFHEN